MPASRTANRLTALISRFRRDRRGNIAVIFAFALLPVLSAIGCATDYSLAARMKAKMQSAADAAAVASISENSTGYLAATKMTSDGAVTVAQTDASNIFNGNVPTTGYTVSSLNVTPTVTKTGSTLTSLVTFSAQVPTVFMNVVGFPAMTITGSSTASASMPLYLDFYLMLDVSESMGLPSTDAEQTRLAGINPDMFSEYPKGCTLACHFTVSNSCADSNQKYPTNNECLGYWISRVSPTAYASLVAQKSTKSVPKATPPSLPTSMIPGLPNSLLSGDTSSLSAVSSCPTAGTANCIQLRADAVGYAVNQLFQTANADQKITNQFRIGLYPFVEDLLVYFPLTSTINGDPTNSSTINYAAANLASLLDTNNNTSVGSGNTTLGSGGTHIDTSLKTMNTTIVSVGNGSASNNTLPYVFLVTDGAQDPQIKGVPNGGWSGSNHATTLDNQGTTSPIPSCAALKNRGIIVSVLYIPYEPIQNPNPSFANDEDDYANSNIQYIQASLQSCASPGFFYTASTPGDITTALNNMFNHALITAHITN
jgi:Flp pilus assembly protein TadG